MIIETVEACLVTTLHAVQSVLCVFIIIIFIIFSSYSCYYSKSHDRCEGIVDVVQIIAKVFLIDSLNLLNYIILVSLHLPLSSRC